MVNYNNICVYDFETGNLGPVIIPIQIAATIINPRTLEIIPGAKFESMMCPPNDEQFAMIEDGALRVNKKTREQIKSAPLEPLVWKQFTGFVKKFSNTAGPPIPAGQNIQGFDKYIVERLCKQYGPWNNKRNEPSLFNNRNIIDLMNISFLWYENSNEPENQKMDTLRDYFGISKDKGHDAAQDTQDTAEIIIRFMKLHRTLSGKISFKDAFKK